MAMFSHRLRRVLLTATSSINRSISLSSPATLAPPPSDFLSVSTVLQRSVLGRWSEVSRIPVRLYSTGKYKLYKEGDEITEETVLFEGCDYNHWLITMDFPKDNPISPEEMVSTYEHTCAKGLGISLEEAKQKIYACSTTTYQGFQAIMTEQESEKFKDLPGVVFILPDSYIDPANKEYGGDKYENGVITHRPPPIQMNRSRSRDRGNPRFDRQGGGGGPQNFQRNAGYGQQQPPMQGGGGNYGPPPQSYGPPGQGQGTQGPPHSYGPPGQGQGTQGPPPPFQGGYNQGPRDPPPPPFQGGYNQGPGSPVPPPFQGTPGGYGQRGAGNYSQGPQGGYNQGGPRNYSPQGSGSYGPPPGAGNPGYGQGGFTGAGQPQNPTIPQADQRIPEWNNNNPAGQLGSDQFPQGRRY